VVGSRQSRQHLANDALDQGCQLFLLLVLHVARSITDR
jgi:hypothetical protein